MPFDRRFSGMFFSSPSQSSQNLAVALRPSHSRQSSIASTILPQHDHSDTPQPPWEVVRWTKLKKISGQVFSEVGKRNYGTPTVMAIGASIVIGTSKGLTLVFDYHQNITATIGLGTKAVECGSATSLAISADHSTVAVGHSTGHIFTWEISRPAKPFLHIMPMHESEQRSSDGHITGSAVVHVGFLGMRHTALVSADNKGMAFSHLATRGLGAVARVVKTARILGRYPVLPSSKEKPRKSSSVLAFASLPLGNQDQPTDALGLTAMLTPYLLVVVSTTPIAETQFKASRPKEIPPHSTLSGCLAWFPAVKLKRPDPTTGEGVSRTKLVYCWSNILTILDIESEGVPEKDRPPTLHFRPRNRWRSPEAIVAVQWIGRSVIGILTISQRLIILEDITLRVADSFDLIQKHIYHHDIFSTQLRSAVESLDDNDEALHGVVADAFHMSFRSYKGRIFILGFNDISIGTLSSWEERLLALLEGGDCVSAIRLAEAYYTGKADKITVGLPDDDNMRHALVRDKLIEILTASLKYALIGETSPVHESLGDREKLIEDLCAASFSAALAVDNLDLLFGEVFSAFEAGSFESVYFQTLEPYILSEEITSVPTEILQHLVMQYNSEDKAAQLETIICHLNPQLMDLHQVTTLCKQFHLYDGLIHVWNQAIGDYVTPLIELLKLVKKIVRENDESEKLSDSGSKIFPYLAHILTGRYYPSGMEMEHVDATRAKSDLYGYLFSATATPWPAKSGFTLLTTDLEEPPYPYLHLILQYDAGSFLSMVHEAFEDQFLNGVSQVNGGSEATNGTKHSRHLPTRQMIVGILLEVLGEKDFGVEDTIYLDMFIARNLPKFPQFIVLPGHILDKILRRLCQYPSNELADDCQLSVEYLLSYYHPSDISKLTHEFHEAGFFRVLKSMYRSAKSYGPLMETYFEDLKDREAVFDCVGDCLRPGAPLAPKQVREVHAVIKRHAQELVNINTPRAAKTLYTYAPQLLEPVLEALDEGSYARFAFLKTLLDSDFSSDDEIHHKFDEQYVQLMCAHEPARVASYIDILKSGDLRLQKVLPAIEKSGAIDAAVVLLSRDGLIEDAMERLRNHMLTLGSGLTGLISTVTRSPDVRSTVEGVEDLLLDVHKYAKVGIWLCQGQTKLASESTKSEPKARGKALRTLETEKDLALDELLWLDLIDTTVKITKDVGATSRDLAIPDDFAPTASKINLSLRSAVQECFTALLGATTRPSPPAAANGDDDSPAARPPRPPQPTTFLAILRAFLARAARASPSLAELRAVLADVFAAHAFEARILALAHRFLDEDLFARVESAWEARQRGWRPAGTNVCERCGRRVWGPGAGAGVWEAWEAGNEGREREERARRGGGAGEGVPAGRGKGKALDAAPAAGDAGREAGEGVVAREATAPLLVFACRHVWHRDCLERTMAENGVARGRGGREFVCQAGHRED
jgi:hypothetical protein